MRTIAACSLAWMLAISAVPGPQQGRHEARGEVAVVVNPDVPMTGISMNEVRHLFLGEKRYWKTKLPVVLIVPRAGTHERDVMLRDVYRMNETQYKEYWIGRIFRAEATSAPKTAESSKTANKLVTSVPGSVTIMNANEVRPGARVLKIDGKLPGERGYPLR